MSPPSSPSASPSWNRQKQSQSLKAEGGCSTGLAGKIRVNCSWGCQCLMSPISRWLGDTKKSSFGGETCLQASLISTTLMLSWAGCSRDLLEKLGWVRSMETPVGTWSCPAALRWGLLIPLHVKHCTVCTGYSLIPERILFKLHN